MRQEGERETSQRAENEVVKCSPNAGKKNQEVRMKKQNISP